MSSKMMDVPDGLFGSKTLSAIYFWNAQIKSWSMRITPVIFDSNQEGSGSFISLNVYLLSICPCTTITKSRN